ncbi:MAG: chaperonin family protein RbcX [Prochlorothrix sp.]
MDLRKIARDSAQTLANYLTYQSVRVVLEQLMETNPPAAQRLREFFATASFQGDSELYLQRLMGEDQEMAFRIMTVRDHLATNIPEFLPEMVRSQVQNSNLDQRKSLFERLTQVLPDAAGAASPSHPEFDLPLELRSLPDDEATDAAA